jgi:hypothetical protein
MVIKERDTGLLKKLSQYGMLSTKQINFLSILVLKYSTVSKSMLTSRQINVSFSPSVANKISFFLNCNCGTVL